MPIVKCVMKIRDLKYEPETEPMPSHAATSSLHCYMMELRGIKITLEPIIFLFIFGWAVLNGTKVDTNLLMWKICHIDEGFSESVCQNLSSVENDQVQSNIQIQVNNFELVGGYIGSIPSIVYSFFAGSLSDDFGRKPLILLPLLGAIVGRVFSIINYIWIRELPTAFFYLSGDFWWGYLGGSGVYYLGVYGYGATISGHDNCAQTLARFDAAELIAIVAGSLLSPVLFSNFGYLGMYILYMTCGILGFVYLVVFVEEPIEKKPWKFRGCRAFAEDSVVKPFKAIIATLVMKRSGHLRMLIYILLIAYSLLWFNYQWEGMEYFYMLKKYPSFTETDYSYYSAVKLSVQSIFLLFFLPLIKVHESAYCIMALSFQAIAFFSLPFMPSLWSYFVSNLLTFAYYGCWATARTLFTFCVPKQDIGKLYALVGILASITPLFSNPAFRQLYNETIDTFPGAILILAGAVNIAKIVIFGVVFYFRDEMKCDEAKPDIGESLELEQSKS